MDEYNKLIAGRQVSIFKSTRHLAPAGAGVFFCFFFFGRIVVDVVPRRLGAPPAGTLI